MDLSKKITIRQKASSKFRIDIKERVSFFCKHCQNRYHDPQYFCPQCLGEVLSSSPRGHQLKIIRVEENRIPEIAQLLVNLSEKKEFSFEKALHALPWIIMKSSDSCVLHHWKEVFEAEKIGSEIEPVSQASKKKSISRSRPPLFEADASLPRFFRSETDAVMRMTARAIRNVALRMKWVDASMQALRILESFYKRNPSARLLFADYLFQIDHELHECGKDFETYYKVREDEFEKVLDRLQGKLQSMEDDIKAVKQQVDESL